MQDRSARSLRTRGLTLEDLESRLPLTTLVIDYSLDTNRFFSTSTASGRAARAALETAADFLSTKLTDTLAAIDPPGGNNSWTPRLQLHPSTGAQNYAVASASDNMKVPANQIIVYAGARNLSSLGQAGPGSLSYSYTSAAWENTLLSRGEGNGTKSAVRGSAANEVAPWGGWVTFDLDRNWHYDHTTLPPANEFDFYSVAVHELTHILGFGLADAWDNLVSGTRFTGSKSVAEYDQTGNVPLSSGTDHWADGTMDGGVETALDPILAEGTRKPMTALDFAALDDIGWQVTAPATLRVAASASSIDEGGGTSKLTFSLSAAAKNPIRVGIAISGTADSGADYSLSTQDIVIPTGSTSASLTITSIADTFTEGNESIVVDVISVAGDAKESGNQRATVTIKDAPPPQVTLAATDTSITENGESTNLTIALTNPALEDVAVDLIYAGSATLGEDYTATATSVSIRKGQTEASVLIESLLDSLVEGNETIVVDIDSVRGGGASEQGTQRATIQLVDLPPPKVRLTAEKLVLGEREDTSTIVARLDSPALEPVSVELEFSGSAKEDADYEASTKVIRIGVGETTGSATITTTADQVAEGTESILIEVASVTGGIEDGEQSVELDVIEPDPIAQPDRFIVVAADEPQTLDVLANDSADGGDIEKVSIEPKSSPAGSIIVTNQNQIEYTAPESFVGMDRFRYLISDEIGRESSEALVETFIVDLDAPQPFHHVERPFDVNDDGVISPVDALLVINDLNNRSGASFNEPAFGFVDTDGNDAATPLDALLVINRLNQGGSGEAEAYVSQAPLVDLVFDGWGTERKKRI